MTAAQMRQSISVLPKAQLRVHSNMTRTKKQLTCSLRTDRFQFRCNGLTAESLGTEKTYRLRPNIIGKHSSCSRVRQFVVKRMSAILATTSIVFTAVQLDRSLAKKQNRITFWLPP